MWQAYLAGESGLVHSATGSGKTLAAWLGPLAEWMEETAPSPLGEGRGEGKAPPLRVLWITPMRALAGDTVLSIERAVKGLGLPWTVGLRTGDTSSAERARQARKLPSALVTTPESLSLMLSNADAREKLSDLRLVVVDEWHELLGNKRGVMTELCLARLRHWNPKVRTWGLSATLGNIDEALERLIPSSRPSPKGEGVFSPPGGRRVVKGVSDKKVLMDTLIPPDVDKFPWAGHLGLVMLDHVIEAIESSRSTLVFTNVRSQAEIWYQGLLEARPEWAGLIGLHHGSLDSDVRKWVEQGLKEGKLKAVVATSSLDLGVDFSPVERVLQIGSPKGVARLLQRAGRSGHAPGQVSRVTCVPSHALEFVEAAAARRAAMAGRIESRRPVDRPLDLLTQHLVTIAAGEGFDEEEMKAEVRSTRAYRDLTEAEWQWALDFVTRGGDALKAYPDYHKVVQRRGRRYRVKDGAIAKRHRMSIGTIVSDAAVDIRYMRGKRLGNVEESFIARLSHGDNFIFAGQLLEFLRVENMTAYVKPGKPGSALIPRWDGGKCPLSSEVSEGIRELLELHVEGRENEPEMKAVKRLLKLQNAWSRVPKRHEMLVEQTETREGHHIFFYPFEGRQVHLGLSALLAYRISRDKAQTFTLVLHRLRLRAHVARALRADPAAEGRALLHRQSAGGHAREPERRRALQAPVPRDRARRGPRLPGVSRAAEDQSPGAGDERPHLRSVRTLGSEEPAAGTSRTRGAGATARVLAPCRGAASHGKDARAFEADPQAFALRLPDHGEPLPREAQQREARRSRASHAARIRQGGARHGRWAGSSLWLNAG